MIYFIFCLFAFVSILLCFSFHPIISDISNITMEVPRNTSHDIFTTLVSDHDSIDIPDDTDFLGETSSAYTSGPDLEYDDNYDDNDDEAILNSVSDDDDDVNSSDLAGNSIGDHNITTIDDLNGDDDSFHAAKGLDLDLDTLKSANASVVSSPRNLKAVIVKHRFVTLSWEEPLHKAEDVTGYAVIYKVKGSER